MPNSEKWYSALNSLKLMHSEIAKLINGRSVAFLDVPMYYNVGDLLIFKGTEQFFKEHNINVIHRSDCYKLRHKKIKEADVILFQGGGNFGDIYPAFQNMREKIVSKYKDKTIICLPQTIHFNSKDRENKSANIFNQHKDFHFFVRDENSKEIAKQFTHNVKMMPDMAHSLHPLVDSSELTTNGVRILNLVRNDDESPQEKKFHVDKKSFDWEQIITQSDLATRYACRFGNLTPLVNKSMELWLNHMDDVVFRSINHFYVHDVVKTDRLHGLILAVLLGKRVLLDDNSYGKNTSYYKAWISDIDLIVLS
ncbi:polysaccharide pyruvyl transferase family protein [Vibrio sp. Sgm 5]|uniref:polysaccharide pyruvyl transferase family protein n=1 Tax=Vibrio sp. Sgm 5 TaxID=2994387 RepID=UPI0022493139|nr:polysaccharide pyruvyl transferase family protein [Vibrio sp. Sgm 5]MCX2792883.1 polysaccharide pyruvyl transferase family protein [Vibrio sp. Sgm 5]